MHTRLLALAPFLALFTPACAPEDEGDVEFRTTLGTGSGSGGGTVFNTNIVDGEDVSELLQPMGSVHEGVALDAVELAGGEAVVEFAVVDGELRAHDAEGQKHAGEALIGSAWRMRRDDPSPYMTAMFLKSRKLVDGWPHYKFAQGVGGFTSTCAGDPDAHARLLPGFTLDEATGAVQSLDGNTYVACTNGATGKAAALGYYDLAVALGDWGPFEVAIRVIRGDYCYDGVSHTTPGVPLNVEDAWGVLADPDGDVEAVWGPDGLLCRGTGRVGEIPIGCGEAKIPLCPKAVALADFAEALFVTRLPASEHRLAVL